MKYKLNPKILKRFREKFPETTFPVTYLMKDVEQFIAMLLQEQREEICDFILKNSHGGGSWRRVTMMVKESQYKTGGRVGE